jgi:hypothetical protein
MVAAMTAELKKLGVPFFGVDSRLISSRDESAQPSRTDGLTSPGSHVSLGNHASPGGNSKSGKKSIDRIELSQLQKRMLELLEDMCEE